MDFVYIVKEYESNPDLRYSLRSICKFYPDSKVWIVGYKPSWIQGVGYIPVRQTSNKWINSVRNIIAACESEEISEDFVLMNDDFFMIKNKYPIEVVGNMNLGTLDEAIKNYKRMANSWCKAFGWVKTLLKQCEAFEEYYNYEAHLPLIINKKKYLEVMNLPEVQAFIKSGRTLHKRTLYKNLVKPVNFQTIPFDVKLHRNDDDVTKRMEVCGWISVYDGQVGNAKYPKLNFVLNENFPTPCKYETSLVNPANIHNTKYVPSSMSMVYKRRSPIKRSKDFTHY